MEFSLNSLMGCYQTFGLASSWSPKLSYKIDVEDALGFELSDKFEIFDSLSYEVLKLCLCCDLSSPIPCREDLCLMTGDCRTDTDALYLANPSLDWAAHRYISSFSNIYQGFVPSTCVVYNELVYSDEAGNSLRRACDDAGGYFDVNDGSLVCDFPCAQTAIRGYVNCLADTPDCKAKDDYEYLRPGMEANGYYNCRVQK